VSYNICTKFTYFEKITSNKYMLSVHHQKCCPAYC